MKSIRTIILLSLIIVSLIHNCFSFSINKKRLKFIIDLKNNKCYVKEYVEYMLDKNDRISYCLEIKEGFNLQVIKIQKVFPKMIDLHKNLRQRLKTFASNLITTTYHNYTQKTETELKTRINKQLTIDQPSHRKSNRKIKFNKLNIIFDKFSNDNNISTNQENFLINNFYAEEVRTKKPSSNNSRNSSIIPESNIMTEEKLSKEYTKNYSPESELNLYNIILSQVNTIEKNLTNYIIPLLFEYEIENFFANTFELLANNNASEIGSFKDEPAQKNSSLSINSDNKKPTILTSKNITKNNLSLLNPNALYGLLILINDKQIFNNADDNTDEVSEINEDNTNVKKPFNTLVDKAFDEILIYIDDLNKELNYANFNFPQFSEFELFEALDSSNEKNSNKENSSSHYSSKQNYNSVNNIYADIKKNTNENHNVIINDGVQKNYLNNSLVNRQHKHFIKRDSSILSLVSQDYNCFNYYISLDSKYLIKKINKETKNYTTNNNNNNNMTAEKIHNKGK